MNMSYCRFRNTLQELQHCADALEEGDELSHEEAVAARRLIRLCEDIAGNYSEADVEHMASPTLHAVE